MVSNRRKGKQCPCCGQAVSVDLLDNAVPENFFWLGAMQQALFDLVKKHPQGIKACDIKDRIYASTRDGGASQHNIVAVMARHVNKKLKPLGMRIKGTGGPGSVYRLIKI